MPRSCVPDAAIAVPSQDARDSRCLAAVRRMGYGGHAETDQRVAVAHGTRLRITPRPAEFSGANLITLTHRPTTVSFPEAPSQHSSSTERGGCMLTRTPFRPSRIRARTSRRFTGGAHERATSSFTNVRGRLVRHRVQHAREDGRLSFQSRTSTWSRSRHDAYGKRAVVAGRGSDVLIRERPIADHAEHLRTFQHETNRPPVCCCHGGKRHATTPGINPPPTNGRGAFSS